jgi:hypothetical protein
MRCHGAARAPATHQGAGAARGERGVAHRTDCCEACDDGVDGGARLRGLRPDRVRFHAICQRASRPAIHGPP